MTKKGKFIVFEGIDGSGKTEQFQLLYKHLKKTHKKVILADFPRYQETTWGKLLRDFLDGKFGKLSEVDPHLALLPYMIDEYTWSRDIGLPWLKGGGIILSNRYFTSNVHQIAKLKTIARSKFRTWLWRAGYEELGIVRPDLVIFLDVPPAFSSVLNKMKPSRDIAEKDWKHQAAAYREYLRTIKDQNYWIRIRCLTNQTIDTPKIIHERVWSVVSRKLGSG